MTEINIINLKKNHYKDWLKLYKLYAEFYKVDVKDTDMEKTWNWLLNSSHPLQGIVAEKENLPIGFAHFRAMPSALEGCEIGFLDDLFVSDNNRGSQIGQRLIEKVTEIAKLNNWAYLQWITKENNYRAKNLYDRIAKKTDWILYEIQII